MAKMKKMQPFRVVKNGRGAEATVYFDPNFGDFYASIGAEEKRDPLALAVQQWVYEHLDNSYTITWIPVIHTVSNHLNRVEGRRSPDPDKQGAQVSFGMERFWVGQLPDKSVDRAHWTQTWVYDPKRPQEKERPSDDILRYRNKKEFLKPIGHDLVLPVKVPVKHYNSDRGYSRMDFGILLPYEEEMWRGFEQFMDAISALGDRFNSMIGSAAGLRYIEEVGAGKVTLRLSASLDQE